MAINIIRERDSKRMNDRERESDLDAIQIMTAHFRKYLTLETRPTATAQPNRHAHDEAVHVLNSKRDNLSSN